MDMKNTKVEFGFPDFKVMIEDTLQKSIPNNVSNCDISSYQLAVPIIKISS